MWRKVADVKGWDVKEGDVKEGGVKEGGVKERDVKENCRNRRCSSGSSGINGLQSVVSNHIERYPVVFSGINGLQSVVSNHIRCYPAASSRMYWDPCGIWVVVPRRSAPVTSSCSHSQ